MNQRIASTLSHAFTAAVLLLAVLAPGCEDPLVQPPPAQAIDSPEKVVAALSHAYQTRDARLFTSILANDADHNEVYLFLLSAPTHLGETQWEYAEETRIHQRMFQPQDAVPPVAAELWLQEVTITLTPMESFGERTDVYIPNGGSLDPTIWRAMDARYSTYVFFDLAGSDYKVEGEANFIVIEDLRKTVGDAGKFLLWVWEDIAPRGSRSPADPRKAPLAVESSSWGRIKELYL